MGGVDDVARRFDLGAGRDDGLDDALNDIAWSLNARDDLHASAAYRREITRRLGSHVIHQAKAEAARCQS